MPDGYWNVDTVYILPKEGKEDDLFVLAKSWEADEVVWLGGKTAAYALGTSMQKNDKQILRVWWD